MKRILAVVLIFSLFCFSLGSLSTKAATTEKDSIKTASELQNKLTSYLKTANPKTDGEVEKVVSDFYKDNNVDKKITSSFDNTGLPNIEYSEGTSENNAINIDKYIDENVDKGNFVEKKVNDNVSVIFTNSPVYFIESTEETLTLPNTNKNGVMRLAASRYKNTKTVTHRYTAKSWVGLTLFKLGVKGYFSYNGSKVKPHLNDAWYTRGTLSIWQVSGWHKGTYTKGSNYAEVYGRGNFHYGFEVKGVGLVIQDKYFKVYLSSNAKGKVSKHTTIR
ncbi:hypothetical protein [Heyndrickxia coagulans]|uniref:Uncharacterized protein n=2 Tax=Bacillaceae TaxID=186817 RepID=A0A150JUI8_HEYCO|nr:hypothetical protein [Heyndrickxia coagulans]KYC60876.1 hypothetical protein B4099_3791 [Heyndrickxia coagulans]